MVLMVREVLEDGERALLRPWGGGVLEEEKEERTSLKTIQRPQHRVVGKKRTTCECLSSKFELDFNSASAHERSSKNKILRTRTYDFF